MARIKNITPNLTAFLDMIAHSELGSKLISMSDDGYNVIVGSTPQKLILLNDYADHPRKRIWFARWKIWSTAAGRYQVLARYYDAYKAQLNLPDFSPESQDKIAIQLIKECKSLPAIERGNFSLAVSRCKSRWASLPGAGYGQRENKIAALAEVYQRAGGTLSKTWTETV